jgi:hypothetical protein
MVALSIATRGGFVAFLVLSGAVAGCLGGDDSEDDRQAVPSGEFLELKERSLDLPSAPTGEFGGGCFRGEDMAVGAISLPGIPGEAALGPWPGQAELEGGPVYVAHSAGPPRVVFLSAARRVPGSSWWAVEMIWVSRPSYDGPVLVRGRRVDRPGGLGFGSGIRPHEELRLPAASWPDGTCPRRKTSLAKGGGRQPFRSESELPRMSQEAVTRSRLTA